MIRFRLQTIFVLVTALAIPLAFVCAELNREQRKQRDFKTLRLLGSGGREAIGSVPKATGVTNGYLRLILGDEYFIEVPSIDLQARTLDDLELLRSFPEVQRLTVGGVEVSDAAVEIISSLPELEYLAVGDGILSEVGLERIAGLSNLKSLRLANCALSAGNLAILAQAPRLRSLELFGDSLPSEVLESLTELTELEYLSFGKMSLDDSQLRALHGARSSLKLELSGDKLSGAELLALRNANPGWSVKLDWPDATPYFENHNGGAIKNFLPSVEELPEVTALALQGPLTSDSVLTILSDAPALESLFLSGELTDESLNKLRSLQRLETLTVTEGNSITDEGLRALAGLTNLQSLTLSKTNFEGKGIAALPPSIRKLYLFDSKITNQGLDTLVNLASLEELFLNSVYITDDGIDALSKLTSLRSLSLWETANSPACLARLQSALPHCLIELRLNGVTVMQSGAEKKR